MEKVYLSSIYHLSCFNCLIYASEELYFHKITTLFSEDQTF